jgi:hypothetical protein
MRCHADAAAAAAVMPLPLPLPLPMRRNSNALSGSAETVRVRYEYGTVPYSYSYRSSFILYTRTQRSAGVNEHTEYQIVLVLVAFLGGSGICTVTNKVVLPRIGIHVKRSLV